MQEEIELVRQQEQDLLDSVCRKNSDLLKKLLAEEFIEAAADGNLYTYQEVLSALQNEEPYIQRQLSDFQARILTPALIQTIYIAEKIDKDRHI